MSRRRPLLDDRTPNTGGGLALLGILVVIGIALSFVWIMASYF